MDLQDLRGALTPSRKSSHYFVALLVVAVFAACTQPKTQLPYYHTPDFTPIWAAEQPVAIDTLHTIAPFSFTNQNGETITNASLAGKIYAANFFFTTCGSICPKMTDNLQALADSFSTNPTVKIVSYSVNPQTDDVATLRQYAQQKSINGIQWHLLTGNKNDINTLARQSYFAEKNQGFTKDATQFLHTEHCILVDKKGHIRGVYNATLKLEIKRLIEDITLLLKED